MKKTLLLMLLSLLYVGGNLAWGQIAAGDYFIQNVESKAFLNGANSWGTKASATKHGQKMTVAVSGDGYTIETHFNRSGHRFLGTNAYVDSDAAVFAIEKQEDGSYAIKCGDNYLVQQGVEANWAAPEVTDAAKWNFLTMEDLFATLDDATAENPVDATFFVGDPNFSIYNEYFSAWQGGPAKGGWNENQCAEKYNCAFDVYQVVKGVPAGQYKLYCQGFYRYGFPGNAADAATNGTEVLDAKLYANTSEASLQSIVNTTTLQAILDQDIPGKGGNWSDVTVSGTAYKMPNNMDAASRAFAAGLYGTELDVVVGETGEIRMGFKKETANVPDGNWTIFDNFEIYYLGLDEAAITAANTAIANLQAEAEALYETPMEAAVLAALKEAVANSTLSATPKPSEIAAKNTLLANAIAAAVASAQAYNNVGMAYNKAMEAVEMYDEEALAAFEEAVMPIMNALMAGEIATADCAAKVAEIYAAWAEAVKVSKTFADGADVTPLIANNSFETGNLAPWTAKSGADTGVKPNSNGTYTTEGVDGDYVFNTWNGSAMDFDVTQVIKNMPKGVYELKALYASDAENKANLNAGEATVEIAANGKGVFVEATLSDIKPTMANDMTISMTSNAWFKADNFRLTYTRALTAEELAEYSTAAAEADYAWWSGLCAELTAAMAGNEEYILADTRQAIEEFMKEDNYPSAINAALEDALEAGIEYACPFDKALIESQVRGWIDEINGIKNGTIALYTETGVVGDGTYNPAMPFFNTQVGVDVYATNTVVIKGWDGVEGSDLKVVYAQVGTLEESEETESRTVIIGLEQTVDGEVVSMPQENEEGEVESVTLMPQAGDYVAFDVQLGEEMTSVLIGEGEEVGMGAVSLYGAWYPKSAPAAEGEDEVGDNMGVAEAIAAAYMVQWPGEVIPTPLPEGVLWMSETEEGQLTGWGDPVFKMSAELVNKTFKPGDYVVVTVSGVTEGGWPQIALQKEAGGWPPLANSGVGGQTYPYVVEFPITFDVWNVISTEGLQVHGDGAYISQVAVKKGGEISENTVWFGEKACAWGNGVSIPASVFANVKAGDELKFWTSDQSFQVLLGGWSGLNVAAYDGSVANKTYVDGVTTITMIEDYATENTYGENTLNVFELMKANGVVMHGTTTITRIDYVPAPEVVEPELLYAADGVVGNGIDIDTNMPFFNTAVKVEAYAGNTVVIKAWDGVEGSDLKIYYAPVATNDDVTPSIIGIEQTVDGEVVSEFVEDDEDPTQSFVSLNPQGGDYVAAMVYPFHEMTGALVEGEAGQVSLYGVWAKMPAATETEEGEEGDVDPGFGQTEFETIEAAYMVTWPGEPVELEDPNMALAMEDMELLEALQAELSAAIAGNELYISADENATINTILGDTYMMQIAADLEDAAATGTYTSTVPWDMIRAFIADIKVAIEKRKPAYADWTWDFTGLFASETLSLLAADSELTDAEDSEYTGWSNYEKNDGSKTENDFRAFYLTSTEAGKFMVGDVEVPELAGLTYEAAGKRSIGLSYDITSTVSPVGNNAHAGYLWMMTKNKVLFSIEGVQAGTEIKMMVESHKDGDGRGVELYTDKEMTNKIAIVEGSEKPDAETLCSWIMPEEGTVYVKANNGCHIYAINLDKEQLPTAISNVNANAENGKIYNLNGVEVKEAVKGLYIINGKKVVK